MATPTMTAKARVTEHARMDPHTARRGMFVLEDGRNVVFTYFLLVFLLALWGFCNGMIDVMDKHFQEELHLNLAQSAWVRFAHYLGYFLMALPAGWLAVKLSYKGGISAGSEQLWSPYAFIGVVVIILAIVFFFAPMPNIEMEDDDHIDESKPDAKQSIWSRPHFWMAVLAQFLYVAAQAGIFSFFINYMTSQVPPVPASWHPPDAPASGFFAGWFETHRNGALGFSNKAASNLASLG